MKTDLLQFISSNYNSKETIEKGRKYEKPKNTSFDDIFSHKRQGANQLDSSKNDNLNSCNVKNQVVKAKETRDKERNIKEQYKLKSEYTNNSKFEINKKAESIEQTTEENGNSLDNLNKDGREVILNCCFTPSIPEVVNSNEELLIKESVTRNAKASIPELTLTELITDIDTEQGFDFALNDYESNSDFTQNFQTQPRQSIIELQQEIEVTKKEDVELENILLDETRDHKLVSLNQSNIEKVQNEDLNTSSLVKIYFNDVIEDEEKNKIDNKIDIISDVTFEEEFDSENTDNFKLQNIFTRFSNNTQSNIQKNINNTFESIVIKEEPVFLNKENIFEQIVEKVKVDIDKTDEIRIKLKPDFLGEVSLKISTEKGIVTAKAYVENFNIKQLIESNLSNLRDSMKELGINFEALDVSVGKDSSFEKNNSQAWKQEQRVRVKKQKLEGIPVMSTYVEDMNSMVGGLYSSNGNIDLIV